MGHKDDHFILASQRHLVFYVDDPMDSEWCIALSTEPRNMSSKFEQVEIATFKELNTISKDSVDVDEMEASNGSYTRNDVDDICIDNKYVFSISVYFIMIMFNYELFLFILYY